MPGPADDPVLTERRGQLLVITLNRPEVRNAINSAVGRGLIEALGRLDDDPELRAGVITGAGGNFCAGMDLKAFAEGGIPEGIDAVFRYGCRKPLVAAIEGFAVGGGLELALVADLLVASREARLGSPEVRFGLFPAGGALLRLPRLIPPAVATELALTGEPMSAADAHHHGLVVRLTDPGGALGAAVELGEAIAENAPLGVDAAKQLLRLAGGRPEQEVWEEQVALAQQVFGSEDAREGARAFVERRPAEWRGR